jgi:energy-coupling factor transporter ATP-binding protein EcfA2
VEATIRTERPTKSHGRHRGVVEVDLTVKSGEIFGYLGPNGAGKTSTVRGLLDLIGRRPAARRCSTSRRSGIRSRSIVGSGPPESRSRPTRADRVGREPLRRRQRARRQDARPRRVGTRRAPRPTGAAVDRAPGPAVAAGALVEEHPRRGGSRVEGQAELGGEVLRERRRVSYGRTTWWPWSASRWRRCWRSPPPCRRAAPGDPRWRQVVRGRIAS